MIQIVEESKKVPQAEMDLMVYGKAGKQEGVEESKMVELKENNEWMDWWLFLSFVFFCVGEWDVFYFIMMDGLSRQKRYFRITNDDPMSSKQSPM